MCRTASSVLVCAALFAGGVLCGCQSHSTSTRGASSFSVTSALISEASFSHTHQFYYYPSTQVYRDCDDDRWLWSEDGGATFQASRTLPAGLSVGDEVPYAVFLTLDEPAAEHQHIAAAYPGQTPTVTVQGTVDQLPY